MPDKNKFLDKEGLAKYHAGIVAALGQKTNKPFIGNTEPTSSDIRIEDGGSIWFHTSEVDTGEETQEVSLTSLDEELPLNELREGEELSLNEVREEEELPLSGIREEEELPLDQS